MRVMGTTHTLLCWSANMFSHRRDLDVHVATRAFYRRQQGRKICIVRHGDSIYAEALRSPRGNHQFTPVPNGGWW
jgi:hypothetical protein